MNSSQSVNLSTTNLAFEEYFERQDKSSLSINDDSNIKKSGKWTAEEDDLLNKYVPIYGEKQWRKIADHVPGRSSIQCLHRWTKILKPGLVKGPWTQEEDQKLHAWVRAEGPTKWAQAAAFIKGRSGKQCRERWFNNLCPGVKKGSWSEEEDEMIFQLYQKYGSSWSKIAKYIPGRTENAIKNRFYSTLRKIAADKKKTFLENSSNDIKRELSDNFSSDEKEGSKSTQAKSAENSEDLAENKGSLVIPKTTQKFEKEKPLEQRNAGAEKSSEQRDGKKEPSEGNSKAEGRLGALSYLALENSQNALCKLPHQDPPQAELPKEKEAGQVESKTFSAVPAKPKNDDNGVHGFVEAVARQLSTTRVKKTDAEFENYLKEIDQQETNKRLMAKKMPVQNSQEAAIRRDGDDESLPDKVKKEHSAFSKNNAKEGNENSHAFSHLGLEFENSMGSSVQNYFNHPEGSERNFRGQRKNNDAVVMRPEASSKGFRVHSKTSNVAYPNLNESRSKLMAESSRDLRYENSLSVSRRDSLNEMGNEMPRKKESVWIDSRNIVASRGIKQVKAGVPEEFENSNRKNYQLNRESSNFEDPQSRNNSSLGGARNFNRSQYGYSQRVTFDSRDAMDEEDQDSTDDIQLSLADELLSSLKFHGNPRSNGRGLIKNINPLVPRETANSGPITKAGPCDDKISSLFQQINSLESLLSTTRNELNKLDNNAMQPDTFDEDHSPINEDDFSHNVLRRSNLRREEVAYNGFNPMKRR